jgi:hypothetical protein
MIGSLVAADAVSMADRYFAGTSPSEPGTPGFTIIAVGDLLRVSIDGLRLRAGASTDTDVILGLQRGEIVRVISGPALGSGYAWYEVVRADQQSGWVAMGGGNDPWLEPAD